MVYSASMTGWFPEAASTMLRTQALMLQARQLRASLVSRTAIGRRVRQSMPRVLRGGSDPVLPAGDGELRERVRAALARRQLPPVGATAWAGPGTGQVCGVCALVIRPSEVEYEVVNGDGRLYAHLVCYTIWCDESLARRQAADGQSSAGR